MKRILLTIVMIFSFISALNAATTPNSVVTPQTIKLGKVQFLQGTDTAGNYKTLYTGGTDGSKIVGLIASTNDASAAHLVTCQVVNSAVKYGPIAVNVPVSSGFTAAAPPINMLTFSITTPPYSVFPLDSDGNPFFYMVTGDTLQCTFATALTSSAVLNVVAIGSDF